MYYIYHIPGKKIGVTRNLNKRVTEVQGYAPNEYEVLDQSKDIDYISEREIELQKSYGYKIDRKPYKNMFNKMKLNATEQTTTFPYPLNKLKGNLMDHIGLQWTTPQGYDFELKAEHVPWIMQNVKESMYNPSRSYIYNKAFYEAFFNLKHNPKEIPKTDHRFDLIRDWAAKRGIYDAGDSRTQYTKLMEEAGELASAILKHDKFEIKDAIGDMVVVLTNLAHLENMEIEDCIDSAYNEIALRTGKMINGTFVKD
jgi:NTP pyrophosphatase (non-canonical NTP hydrolase)